MNHVIEYVSSLVAPNVQAGAIDVIAIRRSDGSIACSPFHVKLGKIPKKGEKKIVTLKVNGKDVNLSMKLGPAGEAFFVERTRARNWDEIWNSPPMSPGGASYQNFENATENFPLTSCLSPVNIEHTSSAYNLLSKQTNEGSLLRDGVSPLPLSRQRSFSEGDLATTNSQTHDNNHPAAATTTTNATTGTTGASATAHDFEDLKSDLKLSLQHGTSCGTRSSSNADLQLNEQGSVTKGEGSVRSNRSSSTHLSHLSSSQQPAQDKDSAAAGTLPFPAFPVTPVTTSRNRDRSHSDLSNISSHSSATPAANAGNNNVNIQYFSRHITPGGSAAAASGGATSVPTKAESKTDLKSFNSSEFPDVPLLQLPPAVDNTTVRATLDGDGTTIVQPTAAEQQSEQQTEQNQPNAVSWIWSWGALPKKSRTNKSHGDLASLEHHKHKHNVQLAEAKNDHNSHGSGANQKGCTNQELRQTADDDDNRTSANRSVNNTSYSKHKGKNVSRDVGPSTPPPTTLKSPPSTVRRNSRTTEQSDPQHLTADTQIQCTGTSEDDHARIRTRSLVHEDDSTVSFVIKTPISSAKQLERKSFLDSNAATTTTATTTIVSGGIASVAVSGAFSESILSPPRNHHNISNNSNHTTTKHIEPLDSLLSKFDHTSLLSEAKQPRTNAFQQQEYRETNGHEFEEYEDSPELAGYESEGEMDPENEVSVAEVVRSLAVEGVGKVASNEVVTTSLDVTYSSEVAANQQHQQIAMESEERCEAESHMEYIEGEEQYRIMSLCGHILAGDSSAPEPIPATTDELRKILLNYRITNHDLLHSKSIISSILSDSDEDKDNLVVVLDDFLLTLPLVEELLIQHSSCSATFTTTTSTAGNTTESAEAVANVDQDTAETATVAVKETTPKLKLTDEIILALLREKAVSFPWVGKRISTWGNASDNSSSNGESNINSSGNNASLNIVATPDKINMDASEVPYESPPPLIPVVSLTDLVHSTGTGHNNSTNDSSNNTLQNALSHHTGWRESFSDLVQAYKSVQKQHSYLKLSALSLPYLEQSSAINTTTSAGTGTSAVVGDDLTLVSPEDTIKTPTHRDNSKENIHSDFLAAYISLSPTNSHGNLQSHHYNSPYYNSGIGSSSGRNSAYKPRNNGNNNNYVNNCTTSNNDVDNDHSGYFLPSHTSSHDSYDNTHMTNINHHSSNSSSRSNSISELHPHNNAMNNRARANSGHSGHHLNSLLTTLVEVRDEEDGGNTPKVVSSMSPVPAVLTGAGTPTIVTTPNRNNNSTNTIAPIDATALSAADSKTPIALTATTNAITNNNNNSCVNTKTNQAVVITNLDELPSFDNNNSTIINNNSRFSQLIANNNSTGGALDTADNTDGDNSLGGNTAQEYGRDGQEYENDAVSLEDIELDDICPEPAAGDFYDSDTDSYLSLSFDDSASDAGSRGRTPRTRGEGPISGTAGGRGNKDPSGAGDVLTHKRDLVRKYRYRKVLIPSQEQLELLGLNDGENEIIFHVDGCAPLKTQLFVWPESAKIIVTDIEGVLLTKNMQKSTAWVSFLGGSSSKNIVNTDCNRLFNNITDNNYRILYITQTNMPPLVSSKDYLSGIVSTCGQKLPNGPIFKSPESLIRAFGAERTDVFKAAALRGVKSLFPHNHNPYHACFGTRQCDINAYARFGFPEGRIFLVNEKGELKTPHRLKTTTFKDLLELKEEMFPYVNDKPSSVAIMSAATTPPTTSPSTTATAAGTTTNAAGASAVLLIPAVVHPVVIAVVPAVVPPVSVTTTTAEDTYNDFNFWRVPIPTLDD